MDHSANSEPKSFAIHCNGTDNDISENVSNVLKLYRCMRKTIRTEPQ